MSRKRGSPEGRKSESPEDVKKTEVGSLDSEESRTDSQESRENKPEKEELPTAN